MRKYENNQREKRDQCDQYKSPLEHKHTPKRKQNKYIVYAANPGDKGSISEHILFTHYLLVHICMTNRIKCKNKHKTYI